MARKPITPAGAKRREERFKLLATFMSNIGAAIVVTGFIAPFVTGVSSVPGSVAAVLAGLAMHGFGQAVLSWVVLEAPVEAARWTP